MKLRCLKTTERGIRQTFGGDFELTPGEEYELIESAPGRGYVLVVGGRSRPIPRPIVDKMVRAGLVEVLE